MPKNFDEEKYRGHQKSVASYLKDASKTKKKKELEQISNQLTDMILAGTSTEEIEKLVKRIMTAMDSKNKY